MDKELKAKWDRRAWRVLTPEFEPAGFFLNEAGERRTLFELSWCATGYVWARSGAEALALAKEDFGAQIALERDPYLDRGWA